MILFIYLHAAYCIYRDTNYLGHVTLTEMKVAQLLVIWKSS